MPSITILPHDVADQIAAGEVVERPASVVKELVENALDAGAREISVVVEDGGRAMIRVSDDGCGMDREDALLALERHGTSKIRTSADLVEIRSFGFRGEALPAIASVSELELETATDDGAGTVVRVRGGSVQEVTDVARRRGTTVSIGRLFHNVPARLKFLRGARSEWRAINDSVTATALGRRDVRLEVKHDGKAVLELPPSGDLRSRVAAIWGGRYADSLVDVDSVAGSMHVRGLAERPGAVGTATRRIFLSVNGRPVRDAGLVRAAEAAYRSTIPGGVRPSLFLELVLPHELVDVNVHPAKAEVRFRDRWPVERAVEAAVRRALGTMESATGMGPHRWTPTQWSPFTTASGAEPFFGDAHALAVATMEPAPGDQADQFGRAQAEMAQPAPLQLRRSYVMFETEDGLVLIDQHAAHERVLYEQFLRGFERGDVPSQRLLLPLTLHLGSAELEALDAHRDVLERVGFELEPFGGNTVLVHAVPAPHPRFDAERCLRETLDTLTGDRAPGNIARHERLLATVACKAAVKAGDLLSTAEMYALLRALRDTDLPAHDVHGRAAVVHLGWAEVERRFGRR
ncbi:MAG TPA: DNA mismatch repair endonuclease MutL [Gemmatimonadaceae bacterium]|nr:DNA mismatch repair endonuclease MutL [Gemmatimonadaceae bacterium]